MGGYILLAALLVAILGLWWAILASLWDLLAEKVLIPAMVRSLVKKHGITEVEAREYVERAR